MTTTDAGRLGEIKVMSALTAAGWYPFVDLSGKCPVDIIAWKDLSVITIQVKSTAYKPNGTYYVVQLGSVRPNRTSNVVKKYAANAQDFMAVYVAPQDKVYLIPGSEIQSTRTLTIDDRFSQYLI